MVIPRDAEHTNSDNHLSVDDLQTIDSILIALGQEHNWGVGNVNYLLEGWYRFVKKVEEGYSGIVPEYQNDLDGRQILQELIDILPNHLALKLIRIVQPWDMRFREATGQTNERLCTPSDVELGWWCFRVPNKINKQLDSIDLLWPSSLT